ncbi:MAG: hypothetical protein NVSMB66_6440 [Candidatus Doudnabacteria bacterium]
MDSIIIFHDGTNLTISSAAADAIHVSKADELRIGGSIYKRSSIAKILTAKDFFDQYPDKRPEEKKEFTVDEIQPMTPEQIERMRSGLSKGLKRFIDEQERQGIQVPFARKIYDDFSKKVFNKNAVVQSV